MKNNIPNISVKEARNIINKGMYLIAQRDKKRYMKFICSYEGYNEDNMLYECIYSKDVISNGFEEIKDFNNEFEQIYYGQIYYGKKFDMQTIISQLPVIIQDSIYAIEIKQKDDNLITVYGGNGYSEDIIVYRKKGAPFKLHNNKLELGKLYQLSKGINFYYIKGNKTYLLDFKPSLLECMGFTIERLFKKFAKEARRDINPNYCNKAYYKIFDRDCDGIELRDFLSQIPISCLKDCNNIVIRSPFEYTDLNEHKYIDESENGYLVYEYYTDSIS